MCSIQVYHNIKGSQLLDVLNERWDILRFKGTDGYGIAGYTNDGELILTKCEDKETLLDGIKDRIKNKEFKWVIAHNRKTSVGSNSLDRTHPVVNENEKLAVIHNGTIKELYNLVDEAKSDTDALALIWRDIKLTFLLKIKEIGVFFVIDWKNKIITFYRDDARTFYINKENNCGITEPIFDGNWALVDPQIVQFTFDEFDITKLKTGKFKKYSKLERKICDYCGEYKPTFKRKNEDICPNCDYLNKKKKSTYTYNYNAYRNYYGY